MTRFIGTASSTFPYSAIAYIEAEFSDGSRVSGTGTLVGRNDVLTAAHVIYDAQLGSATSVTVQFGRDGASRPYGSIDAELLNYFELDNETPGFFTQAESEFDIGLVSLGDAIGDDIGWFALGDVAGNNTYFVTGYPGVHRDASGPRQVEESGSASLMPGFDLVSLENFDINPGNSGGPIWYGSDEGPVAVGVVSTDLWGAEVSAHYSIIADWMAANNYLIPPLQQGEFETPFGIQSSSTPVDQFATLLRSVEWELPDALYNELQGRDELLRYPALESTIDPVIRLYTGMLGREPDLAGVEYWITQFNLGSGLDDLAAGFVASNEFALLANQLGGGTQGAVEALYSSVLGRGSDADGKAYWLDLLSSGDAGLADMAIAFTDSSEYQLSSYSLVQGAKLLLWGADLRTLNPSELGFGNSLSADELTEAGALVRLYQGVLGRAPDDEGLGYWLDELSGGQSLVFVADAFIDSSEFLAMRTDETPEALISALYNQVLSRGPDEEGKNFWLDTLAQDNFTRGDLALAFTESAEFRNTTNASVQSFLASYQQPDLTGVYVDTETYLLG